jgi:hypothetical protein
MCLLAAELLHRASRELRFLGLVRGASRRTARRTAQATAILVAAAALLGAGPLVYPARASDPHFLNPYPFGLSDVSFSSKPAVTDIDGDGDLDAFVGVAEGDTFFFRNTGSAQSPSFAAPARNPFGLADVGDHASPAFADIDGDGDLDAFVGNYYGEVFFFHNSGSAREPAFASRVVLAAVDRDSSPSLVDIDGDGDLDAFVGDEGGDTFFFRNTGTVRVPAFAAPVINPFGVANIGRFSSPAFIDIDGDGDLDAFVGTDDGDTIFFRNTGNAQAPAFATPVTNPFGLADVGHESVPAFGDLDGDGDLDVLVGWGDGSTRFFRNTGTARTPAFVPPPGLPEAFRLDSFSVPALADIDGDGDLDAFVGFNSGETFFFRNTGTGRAPAFADPERNPFDLKDVDNGGAPALADIDGDGDLDAFIGSLPGDTAFFSNTGTALAPAFADPVINPFGLANVGGMNTLAFPDIDADGDLDAFLGHEDGNIRFFENTGSVVAPAFGPPLELERAPWRHPAFGDVDGDGDLDALAGHASGATIFLRNTGSAQVPALAAAVVDPFGFISVSSFSAPALGDIDGDGDLDALVGAGDGRTLLFENRACAGDCDARGQASIDELVRGVNIALGSLELSACAAIDLNGDAAVTIDELIGAVIAALNGCPP